MKGKREGKGRVEEINKSVIIIVVAVGLCCCCVVVAIGRSVALFVTQLSLKWVHSEIANRISHFAN
jgi:hypothetical protein